LCTIECFESRAKRKRWDLYGTVFTRLYSLVSTENELPCICTLDRQWCDQRNIHSGEFRFYRFKSSTSTIQSLPYIQNCSILLKGGTRGSVEYSCSRNYKAIHKFSIFEKAFGFVTIDNTFSAMMPVRCCFERVESLRNFGNLHRHRLLCSHNNNTFIRRLSTTTVLEPSDDQAVQRRHILLILGKPGGGKGTISGKILQVRAFFPRILQQIAFSLSRVEQIFSP
jgi:hypothetical protein